MPRRSPIRSDRSLARLVPILTLVFVATARGETSLKERVEPLLRSHRGKVALAVEHLETGESYRVDADVPMPTASLIKFPVMVEAYRQSEEDGLDLARMVTLHDDDKVPGSGILTVHFSDGATFSLRDAIRLMIAYSDNTATNLVLDEIGLKSTAETMEEMGYPETKIHSKVYRRDTSVFPERSPKYGLGSTTADDMIALLRTLYARELISEEASEAMYDHLLHCEDGKLFKRFLPEGIRVAHKTGAVNESRTSAGIIETPGGPVALCVLTNENEDTSWGDHNAAELLIAEVAREVYNHFNRLPTDAERAEAEAIRPLKVGDVGPEVESLQRRLNVSLDPSPGLSVDGDFGPATESALRRFQELMDIPETGVADERTLEALDPEPEPGDEPEAPTPEQVNAEELPTAPADPLDGPPFVTARAWVVLDEGTGDILASQREDEPLDMASTTKVMTAMVVLRLAEEDPGVLDEVVTFSDRADRTIGSTSGLRAGERVTVRELLYGLLLPSGNDASVALAEHFGARLGSSEDDPAEIDPLARFVAAMNRTAEELGLKQSHFENPHGLTADEHKTSAHDLARLAAIALEDPIFAEVVTTRKHGARVFDLENKGRNVVWMNTNQLLPIAGFDGVKTGTTNAAGACLIASARRGGDHLVIVVLGSTSSDARYTDARNLARWAWSELGREAATAASP